MNTHVNDVFLTLCINTINISVLPYLKLFSFYIDLFFFRSFCNESLYTPGGNNISAMNLCLELILGPKFQ